MNTKIINYNTSIEYLRDKPYKGCYENKNGVKTYFVLFYCEQTDEITLSCGFTFHNHKVMDLSKVSTLIIELIESLGNMKDKLDIGFIIDTDHNWCDEDEDEEEFKNGMKDAFGNENINYVIDFKISNLSIVNDILENIPEAFGMIDNVIKWES